MKVAYYSPMPPERTGIADYSAHLVPELAKLVDLQVQKRGRHRPPRDAGGPLEVVADRETGLVCEPRPPELAIAFAWLREHGDEARRWGRAGRDLAAAVTWDRAIERLLG